ncbi:MAG: hypothetical protein IPJ42_17915 [Betaproteobacteria bacterium]|nr:hypothetical protein [Betaproteobacteria bacterium]
MLKTNPSLRTLKGFRHWPWTTDLEVLPRVPLIPGVTDTDENLGGIVDPMKEENGVKKWILPYNPIWLDKLPRFGGTKRLDIGEQNRQVYE